MRDLAIHLTGASPLKRLRLWHVVFLALALRLIWSALVPIRPVSDSLAYDELAQQLASGQGYRWRTGHYTAYWPVGTSAFYAGLYKVFGRNMAIVVVVNSVLGAGLCAGTYALARTRFDQRIAILSALVVAVWPTWIAFTTIISSELATNLLLVAGVAISLSRPLPLIVRVVAGSVLLTAAAYFRANMLPFVVIVPILAAIDDGKPRQILFRSAVALLIAAVLIAPWAARNKAVLGAPVPISTNFGINLWIGNNPQATGGYTDPPAPSAAPLPDGEVERDRAYQTYAVNYIRTHWGRYVMLCAKRTILSLDRETFGVLWNEEGISPRFRTPIKVLMSGYWYLVLLASLIGCLLYVRASPRNILSPLIIIPVATLATPILVMANERYHYSVAPFAAVFAAYALLNAKQLVEQGRYIRNSEGRHDRSVA